MGTKYRGGFTPKRRKALVGSARTFINVLKGSLGCASKPAIFLVGAGILWGVLRLR